MAEPLTATHRLTLSITVAANVTHKQRVYVEAVADTGAPSGYFVKDRTGTPNIDAGAAAQEWWTNLRPAFDQTVLAPPWLLEARVGTLWTPLASGTTTGAGTFAGGIFYASQMTISMRTTDFKRVRLVVLEQAFYQACIKKSGYAAFNADLAGLASTLNNDGATHMYKWVRSRNNKMLHGAAAIISVTVDFNDKVRRTRNLT